MCEECELFINGTRVQIGFGRNEPIRNHVLNCGSKHFFDQKNIHRGIVSFPDRKRINLKISLERQVDDLASKHHFNWKATVMCKPEIASVERILVATSHVPLRAPHVEINETKEVDHPRPSRVISKEPNRVLGIDVVDQNL